MRFFSVVSAATLVVTLASAAPTAIRAQGAAQSAPRSPATATLRADQFDSVRALIRRAISGGVPSLAVAVAKDGRIIWEEGFGVADRERNIAAGPHTMYSLASISKPFTATAIM